MTINSTFLHDVFESMQNKMSRNLKENGINRTMVITSDKKTTGTSSDFIIQFNPPIDLTGSDRWHIAPLKIESWFTWWNVSNDYGNRIFKYWNNVEYKTITLDEGTYSAADLIASINAGIAANGDDSTKLVWSANLSTQKFVLTLSGGYKVDFTNMPIRVLFGAESTEYDTS